MRIDEHGPVPARSVFAICVTTGRRDVRSYARCRVHRNRLRVAGFGLTKPVASNQTEAGTALNGRVELVRL